MPTRRRLMGKQPANMIAGTKRMLELKDDPERVTAGEATMQCEEPGTSSTQVKRAAEEIQDSDAMVEFMEILNAEVDEGDHVFIMLLRTESGVPRRCRAWVT